MREDDHTIISFESRPGLHNMVIGEENDTLALDHRIDQQRFNIRMANSLGRRESASLLIKKMYAWRGYDVDPSTAHAMNKITLFAESDGQTVGTMTLCLDDDAGLPADENFKDRLDELRAQGRRLCEPSRLAIDKGVSKRVFAALIHISYIYAHNIHKYTDYVIEVNPRHVMFYKRMLGFGDFGGQRNCTRVNAPAVLLRLELDYMKEQIEKFGGLMEQHGAERTFYPYFFPTFDEPGITVRLQRGRS